MGGKGGTHEAELRVDGSGQDRVGRDGLEGAFVVAVVP